MTLKNLAFTAFIDGERNRKLGMWRPCPCGCDGRRGKIAGYLHGIDSEGKGFSVYAKTEEEYQAMRKLFGGER